MWRHTCRGDKYVTVIIDLTPARDGTGPARLLDIVEGRFKPVFKAWLERPALPSGRTSPRSSRWTVHRVQDRHRQKAPDATAVMDPCHVVQLAGDALDECRRRVQQQLHGHRGRKDDPLYKARRTLHTGADLLTERQHQRITALFAVQEHVEVEATWGIYQRMIAAYRQPERARGRELMKTVIDSAATGVPAALSELVKLGRTLAKRAAETAGLLRLP